MYIYGAVWSCISACTIKLLLDCAIRYTGCISDTQLFLYDMYILIFVDVFYNWKKVWISENFYDYIL